MLIINTPNSITKALKQIKECNKTPKRTLNDSTHPLNKKQELSQLDPPKQYQNVNIKDTYKVINQ